MRKLGLSTTICFLLLGLLVLSAASPAQTHSPVAEKFAKTYGLDSWDQIDAVRYTFNVSFPGVKAARTWTWEPKTGKVAYESKDKDGKPVKAEYNRNQLSSAPENVQKEIEPAFVNDNYWFLFPFHAYWDTSADVKDMGMQKLPAGTGTGTARQIVVKYPSEVGGYTPGDTWEFFLGPDGRAQAMVYRRGGDKKPSLVIAKWAGYKKAGPLVVSTEHPGTADGKPLTITFTNVAYKLKGSDAWVDAK